MIQRLRRSDCSDPGITRRRRGKGFEYLDADGERVTDADVLPRAAVALAVAGSAAATKSGRKRAITRAVKEVAHYLGNTPAVARASYIDPRVFDRYRDGTAIQGEVEEAVLDLVTRNGHRAPGLDRVEAIAA